MIRRMYCRKEVSSKLLSLGYREVFTLFMEDGKYILYLDVPEVPCEFVVIEVRGMVDGMPVVRRQKLYLSWITVRDWDDTEVEDITMSTGSRVILTCTFRDWSGNKIDPSDPWLITYNHNKKPLMDRYYLTSNSRKDTGEYFYEYQISGGDKPFFVEFGGYVDGRNLIVRREIKKEWVKGMPSLC